MAGKYSIGFLSAAAGPGAAYAVLQNPVASATGMRLKVREVGFTSNANTSMPLALAYIVAGGLGTASGTTPAGIPNDDADKQTALGTLATTWSSPPTTPTLFFRRFFGVATAGSGYVWNFEDDPLIISPTAGLALWNPDGSLTGPQLAAWFKWTE
jgi:hypothetical protein